MVSRGKRLDHEADRLDALLHEFRLQVIQFDWSQAAIACDAFRPYGKGRHPAGLNFGDCMIYRLAKARDDVLLFKGGDFLLTDIRHACRPGGATA